MGTLEVVFLPADTLKIIAVRILNSIYNFCLDEREKWPVPWMRKGPA
jgi:hypothetical protein